jgi:hypothetical protein
MENKTKITTLGEESEQRTFLEVKLPAPPLKDSKQYVTYGAHNQCHMENYQQIGNVLYYLVKNQERMIKDIKELKNEIELRKSATENEKE